MSGPAIRARGTGALSYSATLPTEAAQRATTAPAAESRSIHSAHAVALEIVSLTGDDLSAWQAYVSVHPEGTLFHEPAWRDAVAATYGHPTHEFLAKRGGRVCGALSLVQVRSPFGGRVLVSAPYGVYGGPLADDTAAQQALNRAAEALAERIGAGMVEYRAMHSPAPPGDGWRDVEGYATFRRMLPERADDVAGWLPRKARAAARRAEERNDLRVSFDANDLDAVWELYARNMRRLGSINYPRRLFRELVERLPDRCLVQVIRTGARPVAGLLTLRWGDVAMPYFVGVDERCSVYGLNNYLYYGAMRRAIEWGCRWFDFGRSRLANSGAVNFKRFHGFEPQSLAYRRFTPAGGREPEWSPTSGRFRWGRRLWPWLPLSVTRPLGVLLSRYIPG